MKRIAIAVVALAFAGLAIWLVSQQPKPQTIALPDGSRLTLLTVTHGTNHVCRYGTRWQQLRDLFLVKVRGATIPGRRATFTSIDTNSVMVWLRHDGVLPDRGGPQRHFVAAVEDSALESRLQQGANVTITLRAAEAARSLPPGVAAGAVGGLVSQIAGWELPQRPRRAPEFRVRVYCQEFSGKVFQVGELLIRNPATTKLAAWAAEPLPATRRTNELEIALTKLETGLTGKETGQGPAGEGAKSFSRATFTLKENGAPTEKWSVCGIRASNAAGEVGSGGSYGSLWQRGEHKVNFGGGLWLEEPAWKLNVDFGRTGDFPSDELWLIKGVSVPQAGELMETRMVTNIHASELEFLGVSGSKANLPEGYAGIQPHANLHVRTLQPLDGLRVLLVGARDNQGRKLQTKGSTASTSTGGRGNTPKEMLHGFAVEIPEDAKSLDITLAATRVRSVEFLARPVMFEANADARNSTSEGNPKGEFRK